MITGQKRIYLLNRYINGGYFTPSGGMLSVFFPQSLFKRNAAVISKQYQGLNHVSAAGVDTIEIPAYTGTNPHLAKLLFELARLRPSLKAAIVHGSYAMGDEILYSDFDALLVISKEAINDKVKLAEAAYKLHQLRKVMHRIDPFQHHGWFVVTEYDLENYPEWFLPKAVLQHGKSLLGPTKLNVVVQVKPDVDFRISFFRLCKSLKRKLTSAKSDWNLFQLKSIFSEFMMLPSAYVQARDNIGIFKKYSFNEMRKDFTPEEFAVMDEVSSIRLNWYYELTEKQKKFLERIDFLSWKSRQKMEVLIPSFIKNAVQNGLFLRMNNFTTLVSNTILNLPDHE